MNLQNIISTAGNIVMLIAIISLTVSVFSTDRNARKERRSIFVQGMNLFSHSLVYRMVGGIGETMGKIKIVKKEEPQICEVEFLREQYETEGQYQVKMLMFGDNYTVAGDSYRTYLTPEAVKEIFDYIKWGEIDRENTAEQGGFLIGRYLYDPEKKWNIAIVETAIPARHARGSIGTLEIQNQDMLEMHQQLDMINNTRSEEDKFLVLGWFHTHPNTLDVFMSGTDRYTQRTFFFRRACPGDRTQSPS